MGELRCQPIDDDTAPIACTLTGAEIPGRIAVMERLRDAMTSIDRTPTGLLLHFPDRPDLRAELVAFALDEQHCCRFWGFEVLGEPGGVALRWDGPPAAAGLLDQLHSAFGTDAPISGVDGLL